MDISLDNSVNKAVGMGQEALDASLVSRPASEPAQLPNNLTVTHATATPEDIAAAGIPDAALSRDDDLGKLIGEVFNLPSPPMCWPGNLSASCV